MYKLKFTQSFGSKTSMDESTRETEELRRKYPIMKDWRNWMWKDKSCWYSYEYNATVPTIMNLWAPIIFQVSNYWMLRQDPVQLQ